MDGTGDKKAAATLMAEAAGASNAREKEKAGESCIDCCAGGVGGFLCFSSDMCADFSQWFNDCCGVCCAFVCCDGQCLEGCAGCAGDCCT